MSSSISSSSPVVRALALAVAFIAVAELCVHQIESRLSSNVKHVESFPMRVEKLRAEPGRNILFVGDSLTRNGVNPEVVGGVLEREGSPAAVDRLHADDTTMVEWYYTVKRYALAGDWSPEFLVIPFVRGQLEDDSVVRPSQLARFFVGPSDVSELFRNELTTTEQRGEFLAARLLAGYAAREQLQRRALDLVIPHYRTGSRRSHRVLEKKTKKKPSKATYERLIRFASLADRRGVRMVVVAMPLPERYKLDTRMVTMLPGYGVKLLDARSVKGLEKNDYIDGYLLNEQGARKLSADLGLKLHLEIEGQHEH